MVNFFPDSTDLDRISKGATDAGKDPARLPISIEQYVVVGGPNEPNEAAEQWRFALKA
jgi:hypothetical protein